MREAINYMLKTLGATKIKISAQKHLHRFYENLGLKVVTEEYLEDGIPHIGMIFKKRLQ